MKHWDRETDKRQVNSRIAAIHMGGEVVNVVMLLVSLSIYIRVWDGIVQVMHAGIALRAITITSSNTPLPGRLSLVRLLLSTRRMLLENVARLLRFVCPNAFSMFFLKKAIWGGLM